MGLCHENRVQWEFLVKIWQHAYFQSNMSIEQENRCCHFFFSRVMAISAHFQNGCQKAQNEHFSGADE